MNAALFDMDGVLVDVSKSYLVAIQKTIEFFFNLPVRLQEIQEYKNRGGLNNDWDLTECILKEKGKEISKQNIIEVFQEFYLGKNFDGLIVSERWLLARIVLEKLLLRYETGIVTGRPRMEAFYVLQRFDFTDNFPVVITMEDVPPDKNKPDPYGIQLALKELSCDSAYYFGDTVDDMVAAKKAGVTPVGIIAPGSNATMQREVLLNHGAVQVLDNVNDVMEVLL